MKIRQATELDARKGSEVLRRSIIELCDRDHAGDPELIAGWTANKTPETWLSWVHSPTAFLFVAEENGQIVGVCMVRRDGEILLNYVSPDVRFRGVSKSMLAHMETEVKTRGLEWCMLDSTETALRFYQSAGYEVVNSTGHDHKRMRKRLTRLGS